MPMFETLLLFALAVTLSSVMTLRSERLRQDFRTQRILLSLLGVALALSAASTLIAERGHAGTGFIVRHGWPKSFFYRLTSETGERSQGFEPLYFAGNTLVYLGALLLLWSLVRLARR